MAWTIEFTDEAQRQLRRLDRKLSRDIVDYLEHRISPRSDPRDFGAALTADRKGYWRYRVSDYRIICRIEDQRVTVVVVEIGHRREIYRR